MSSGAPPNGAGWYRPTLHTSSRHNANENAIPCKCSGSSASSFPQNDGHEIRLRIASYPRAAAYALGRQAMQELLPQLGTVLPLETREVAGRWRFPILRPLAPLDLTIVDERLTSPAALGRRGFFRILNCCCCVVPVSVYVARRVTPNVT